MKKNIVLLDIKMGNVDSIIKAVEYNGYKCKLSNSRKDLEKSDIIILPGQGAFDSAMKNIQNLKIDQTLIEKSKDKTLFLGICLGMHLMADFGYENNKKTRGLGLINGEVKILPKKKIKIPHLGWNEVKFKKKDKILMDISNKKDFYFLHSYYFDLKYKKNLIATSNYGINFPSIIKDKNIYGVQFHPEKSLWAGVNLIKNFIELSEKN